MAQAGGAARRARRRMAATRRARSGVGRGVGAANGRHGVEAGRASLCSWAEKEAAAHSR